MVPEIILSQAQPHGSAATESCSPTAADGAHCLGTLWQAEARWLKAVFLGGTLLPYTANVLKSAAMLTQHLWGQKAAGLFLSRFTLGPCIRVLFSCVSVSLLLCN